LDIDFEIFVCLFSRAKIAKCSPDTALRDIKDLMDKQILRQEQAGGRSTNYELEDF
jgi:Fic family protein